MIAYRDIGLLYKVFQSHSTIKRVILYGSRAKGNYRKGSDIDLTIDGVLTKKEFNQVEIELDNLLLPYQIDLSLLSDIDDSQVADHINRVGKVFYRCV